MTPPPVEEAAVEAAPRAAEEVRGSGILVERNVIIEEATMSEATNTCPENAKRDPQLMTAREVAQKLRLSVSFIYERIADGSLPHFRLGSGQGGIRVSEEQLAAYLRSHEQHGKGGGGRHIQ